MEKMRIIFGISIVLAVLTVLTATAVADNVLFFVPQNSSGAPGENVTVLLYLNATDDIWGGQVRIDFDPNVVNITEGKEMTEVTNWDLWDFYPYGYAGHPYAFITFMQFATGYTGDMLGIANLTLVGGNISGITFLEMPVAPDKTMLFDEQGDEVPTTTVSGTFACNKSLPVGWNLVSRPDITADNSTANVLAGVSYDAVYRYDATTKDWVDVTNGTMEPGIGYFVHVTAPSNWTFTGTPYTQMNISLEPGLNMIGWLDCKKTISDALSHIDGEYWYATTFNASEQRYTDTFNPVAPDVFNRLTTMEPGAGYFISAKQGGWLNVSC